MKLITWNCQGAFRRKAQLISQMAPDIAVIQECESPAKLRWAKDVTQPNDYLWYGLNPSKGIGIFSWTDWTFAVDPCHDAEIHHGVPIVARRGEELLHLVAIWASGHKQKELSYVGQVYRAVETYRDFIRERPTFVIGDWNSNAIWDRERRVSNHSNVIKKLAEAGLVSLYHEHFGEAHGRESQMTFWWHRDQSKGYHLDYCVAPQEWLPRLKSLHVGDYETWRGWSDHSPVMVDIE
ncbi:MAG: hypothetical protein U0175_26295 [Caldilineaceae bacterium]